MTDDVKTSIAARAARELRPGEVVNLGIGIPNLIPGLLGGGTNVFLHTENGLLGVGPRPGEGELDPDLIDAAKQPVTALPGSAYFDSAQSFAMIRGGHIHVAVLGALQVSITGDIANWAGALAFAGGSAAAAADAVTGLDVDAERMRANLEASGGLVVAERVSFTLTPRLGRSRAHELVAEAARAPSFREALLIDQRTGLSAEELDTLLDPTGYLGAAEALVDRALGDYEQARR